MSEDRFRAWLVLLAGLAATLLFAQALQGQEGRFDALLALTGTWDATEVGNDGFEEVVTYRLTGRGTVLMEEFRGEHQPGGHMLTAYHMDGTQLVMTHFCGAGNQPRMRLDAAASDERRLRFELYDITNLPDESHYHSTSVDVLLHSEDRVDLVYEGRADATPVRQVFRLRRRTDPAAR